MRIISGIHKGRNLKVPSSKFTRPTTDKVRESLFNILFNTIDFDGIEVLDIYAGSGSLGLEALSRGACKVDFVEKNFPVYKILSENISHLKVDDRCYIYKMEAIGLSRLANHRQYHLILADPPFFKDDIHDVVKNLLANSFLYDEGMMIVERSIQTKQKDVEHFGIEPFKRIGDTFLYKFEKPV